MVKKVVHVEYCGKWGYYPRYLELADKLKAADPEVEVTGEVGRSSSFEVKLNDEVVFSKLETGGFPIMEKLVEYIKSFDGQSKVVPLSETQSSCVIL